MINLKESLKIIRERRPLVHHIMNYVVMTDAANATLAIGASPIMAHATEELEELAAVAGAIYINIGTLDRHWIESMIALARHANKYGKPLLLDPVGAGATRLRTETSRKILEIGVTVLKGNAGEIAALAGIFGGVKGVDSELSEAAEPAERLASEYGITVVSTGRTDYVARGGRLAAVEGGSKLFRFTTGSGCMLGSVMASFMAVVPDSMRAAIEGSLAFKVAGETAERRSGDNPGTFRVELMNALYNLDKIDEEYYKGRVRFLK